MVRRLFECITEYFVGKFLMCKFLRRAYLVNLTVAEAATVRSVPVTNFVRESEYISKSRIIEKRRDNQIEEPLTSSYGSAAQKFCRQGAIPSIAVTS